MDHETLSLILIPSLFLNYPTVTKSFVDILLSFLVSRMNLIQDITSKTSQTLLGLFRFVFGSLTKFTDNESVLRSYLNDIVLQAMQLAQESTNPLSYCSLLRNLFRGVGGGKFESLYKEFLPLLPELLHGLMRMQQLGPESTREITIELCLTVPARLSSLLPFIPLLMRAVVLALKGEC